MALGAPLPERADVSRLVLRDGAKLTAFGVALGVVATFFLTRLMSSLLFGVDARDITTYGVVAFFLAAVSLLASYLPTRRASTPSTLCTGSNLVHALSPALSR